MSAPPPLPPGARAAAERTILIVAGSAAAAAVILFAIAGVLHPAGLPCGWKTVTGLPCLGCGGTRALFLLARGEWGDALRMNPGAVLAAAGVAIAAVYAAGVVFLGLSPWRPQWAARVPWRWLVLGAILANWAYLLAAGRA